MTAIRRCRATSLTGTITIGRADLKLNWRGPSNIPLIFNPAIALKNLNAKSLKFLEFVILSKAVSSN